MKHYTNSKKLVEWDGKFKITFLNCLSGVKSQKRKENIHSLLKEWKTAFKLFEERQREKKSEVNLEELF